MRSLLHDSHSSHSLVAVELTNRTLLSPGYEPKMVQVLILAHSYTGTVNGRTLPHS